MVLREQKYHCTDCYFSFVKTSGYNKKYKWKIEYPSLPSAICPVPHSAEIPVPVFAQLPCPEDMGYDEKLSESNDADFEIEQESVRTGFHLSDLHEIWDYQKRLQKSELKTIYEKNLLEKERRNHTFDTEKVRFCSTFEVTVALFIAIT